MPDADWKQAITLILLDSEGETVFRADMPIEIVEEDGQALATFPPEVVELDEDAGAVTAAVVRMKHSNRAGRAMARAGIPPEPPVPTPGPPEPPDHSRPRRHEEEPDERDAGERLADEEAEDAERRLDAEKAGDL